MNQLTLPCPTGQVSDGYHTFDELYLHRNSLFAALMKAKPEISWYSTKHDDGTMYPGWFIAGMNLPTGNISYHIPITLMWLLDGSGIKRLDTAPKWDGHASLDVVARLQDWHY